MIDLQIYKTAWFHLSAIALKLQRERRTLTSIKKDLERVQLIWIGDIGPTRGEHAAFPHLNVSETVKKSLGS